MLSSTRYFKLLALSGDGGVLALRHGRASPFKASSLDIIPELRLCYAVIRRAVLDATNQCSLEQKRKREAISWLMLWIEQPDPVPFSFQWLCEAQSLNPHHVRHKLWQVIKASTDNQYRFALEPTNAIDAIYRDDTQPQDYKIAL